MNLVEGSVSHCNRISTFSFNITEMQGVFLISGLSNADRMVP